MREAASVRRLKPAAPIQAHETGHLTVGLLETGAGTGSSEPAGEGRRGGGSVRAKAFGNRNGEGELCSRSAKACAVNGSAVVTESLTCKLDIKQSETTAA